MMNQLQAALKAQGTFAQRKQARVAAGSASFTFEITSEFHGLLRVFSSRQDALEFAFGQVGMLVGNTLAKQAIWVIRRKLDTANWYCKVCVERVNAASGERTTVRGMQ